MIDRNLAFLFDEPPAEDTAWLRRTRPKLQLVASTPARLRFPARKRFTLRIDDGGFRPYRSFWG